MPPSQINNRRRVGHLPSSAQSLPSQTIPVLNSAPIQGNTAIVLQHFNAFNTVLENNRQLMYTQIQPKPLTIKAPTLFPQGQSVLPAPTPQFFTFVTIPIKKGKSHQNEQGQHNLPSHGHLMESFLHACGCLHQHYPQGDSLFSQLIYVYIKCLLLLYSLG